mgnify:CR=1 FL=1
MTEFRLLDVAIGASVAVLALVGIMVLIPAGIILPGDVDIAALSPDFWPRLVMIGLAVAGLVVLLQGTLLANTQGDEAEQEASLPLPVAVAKLLVAVIALFIYYVAISEVGIVLSSSVILIGLMMLGGERRIKVLLPVGIAPPVLLYYFFTYVANVPLPLGVFQS